MDNEPLDPLLQPSSISTGDEMQQPASPIVQVDKNDFVFSHGTLKKKLRLSEFLSEKIITGVAFLSITIIVLIFVFVGNIRLTFSIYVYFLMGFSP